MGNNSDIQELQDILDNLTNERDFLLCENEDLLKENEILNKTLDETQQLYSEEKTRSCSLEEECYQVKSALSDLREKNHREQKHRKAAECDCKALKDTNCKLNRCLVELQCHMEQLQEERDKLRTKCRHRSQKLRDTSRAGFRKEKETLEQENRKLYQTCQNLNVALHELKSENIELQLKCEHICSKFHQCKQDLDEAEVSKICLEKEMKRTFQNKLHTIKPISSHMTKKKLPYQAQSANKKHCVLNGKLQENVNQLTAEKNKLDNKISTLERILESKCRMLDSKINGFKPGDKKNSRHQRTKSCPQSSEPKKGCLLRVKSTSYVGRPSSSHCSQKRNRSHGSSIIHSKSHDRRSRSCPISHSKSNNQYIDQTQNNTKDTCEERRGILRRDGGEQYEKSVTFPEQPAAHQTYRPAPPAPAGKSNAPVPAGKPACAPCRSPTMSGNDTLLAICDPCLSQCKASTARPCSRSPRRKRRVVRRRCVIM